MFCYSLSNLFHFCPVFCGSAAVSVLCTTAKISDFLVGGWMVTAYKTHIVFLLLVAGMVLVLLEKCISKKPHSLATSNSECNLHCRKLTFYFINILLYNLVLLRKVKFCCAHIKCRTFFRQIDLAGSARVYLIQTDSGSLCKFFVTDTRALQTAEHPHCFVLYGHFIYLRFCCSRCIFILDILLPEERRKNKNSF